MKTRNRNYLLTILVFLAIIAFASSAMAFVTLKVTSNKDSEGGVLVNVLLDGNPETAITTPFNWVVDPSAGQYSLQPHLSPMDGLMLGKQPVGSESLYLYRDDPVFNQIVDLFLTDNTEAPILINLVPDSVEISINSNVGGGTFDFQVYRPEEDFWEDYYFPGISIPENLGTVTNISGGYRLKIHPPDGYTLGSAPTGAWYEYKEEGGEFFIYFKMGDASQTSFDTGGNPVEIMVNFDPIYTPPPNPRVENGYLVYTYENLSGTDRLVELYIGGWYKKCGKDKWRSKKTSLKIKPGERKDVKIRTYYGYNLFSVNIKELITVPNIHWFYSIKAWSTVEYVDWTSIPT